MIGRDDPVTIRPDHELNAWRLTIGDVDIVALDLATMSNLVTRAAIAIRQTLTDWLAEQQEAKP